MKVSIGYNIVSGPWGGGNRFLMELTRALELNGHKVVFNLGDSDIDIILIVNPSYRRNPNVTFSARKILNYLIFTNPEAVVVHRINECDERKNTKTMNLKLRTINYIADHTVFIASWLKNLNVWRQGSPHSVLLIGASQDLFYPTKEKEWSKKMPLSLVTHHWGGNRLKGFDVYEYIDKLLDQPLWASKITFTYIGNLPKGSNFKNVKHIQPLDGKELADSIREHDIYLTASINEPAGYHHIEGACCGLPLLYRNSGALPEYCDGFGVEFDGIHDIEEKLTLIIDRYDEIQNKMHEYPNTSNNRTPEWVKLFELLYSKKKEISLSRKLWRNPFMLIKNQVL